MRAERRRLWKAAAVVALVGLGVTGCGSSGKKDKGAAENNAAGGQKPAGPGNGRVLIILDQTGRLAAFDAMTGDRHEIADAFVKSGGLALPVGGLALFQARGKPDEDGDEGEPDGRLVIIDAAGATVTPTIALKTRGDDSSGEPRDLQFFNALRESGGGRRFAMIPTDAGTLLVNLEKRSAVELTEVLGEPGTLGFTTRFSKDERWGIIGLQDKGLVLFSTDDPAKHTAIDGSSLGFSADSKVLFVDKPTRDGPGKVWGVPVDGGGEVVFAEGDIRFRGSVGNSVAVAEPTALYLSNKAGDRRPLDVPYNREEDEDTFVIPMGTGSRGFLVTGDEEDRRWALVDETEAKVTPLPALDKFSIFQISDERVLFAGAQNEEAQTPTSFAIFDIASGKVTPAATWDPAGAQVPYSQPSPDGRSVALPYSREGEQGSRTAILTPGEGLQELEGGFAAWAPDGTAVLLVRRVGDGPHMIAVDLATKKEKDLGPGFGGVWTAS